MVFSSIFVVTNWVRDAIPPNLGAIGGSADTATGITITTYESEGSPAFWAILF